MAETTPTHFRIPGDVLTAARARAAAEHRTLTDVVVRYLREYGSEAEPEPPPRPAPKRKTAAARPAPAIAAEVPEPRATRACTHPGTARKARCIKCGQYNLG